MRTSLEFLRCYGYVALATARLLGTPMRSATRAEIRRVARAAGWQGITTALHACTLGEMLASRSPVRVDNTTVGSDNTSFYELFVLSQLVADRQPRVLFEFGTYNGRSTLHLAMNSPEDARVTTLDLPPHECTFEDAGFIGRCFRDTPWAAKITQVRENTRRFDPAPHQGKANLIFIDASHDYEDVQHDTDLALRLAAPGDCLILWHDYARWHGVRDALDERYHAGGRFTHLRRITGTSLAALDLGRRRADNTPHELAAQHGVRSPLPPGEG